MNQLEAQLNASKATVKQAQDSLQAANAVIANAQANVAKAKAADDLAKTQEQIALNTQRADAGAISVLNVAKARQERQEADAAVEQAEASVTQAQASALQAAATVQVAQSNVPAIEAQLNDARFNLAQCKMTAPGDGYVVNWQVQVGTMLVPAPIAPAGTFVITSDTSVAAVFPQNWLSNVQPGDDVEMVLIISRPPVPGKSGLRDIRNGRRPVHDQRNYSQRSQDRIGRALRSQDQFHRRGCGPQAISWLRWIGSYLHTRRQGDARYFEGGHSNEEVAVVRHALCGNSYSSSLRVRPTWTGWRVGDKVACHACRLGLVYGGDSE